MFDFSKKVVLSCFYVHPYDIFILQNSYGKLIMLKIEDYDEE